MINKTQLQLHKPFFSDLQIPNWRYFYRRVNVVWWLIRIPMLLLAAPSAYGVAGFAHDYLPAFWAWLAGAAFESTYIGAIALADQEAETSAWLWWIVNGAAVIFSILSNLLYFAHGSYSNITPEIATHALPNAMLGFLYSLLVHEYSTTLAAKYRASEDQKRKELDEKPFACDYCGTRFATIKQKSGHLARCQQKPSRA